MDMIANRYRLDQPLKQMAAGRLARGTDLTANREVLLYMFQESDEAAHQEALRWLGKASRLSDEHFMRILDIGSDAGTLFAVLHAETGGLLSERLKDLDITGRQALKYAHGLAVGIREARRNRLPECSVDVENLWVDEKDQLHIVNYWSEGKNGRRSVPGLALLLYQLGAKTDTPTSSMRAYSYELNRFFADLPDEIRESAAALSCKAYEGTCTLADFQQGLEALLGFSGGGKDRFPLASMDNRRRAEGPQPGKPPAPLRSAADTYKAERHRRPVRDRLQLRRWHLFAAAGCGLFVLLLWLASRSVPGQANGSELLTTPTPAPATASIHRTEATVPSTTPVRTVEPTAAPTIAPTATPTEKPAGDGGEQAKPGVVPNLVTHSKEDAEKLAVAAGLRYQFFMEANDAPAGVVFKQDLAPGTSFKQGDRITFWVSKGK